MVFFFSLSNHFNGRWMMSCCRCIKRLEHVEKVIETYDPNENFVNYDLLTVWVNKKTKKAFILVSKENGIATWVPINADITTIDKIILNCGEVEANENNEIVHTGECGARTVTDDCTDLCITIETEWGLKGGGIVCAGEKLTLGIDLANTNLVISNVTDVQDGDLVAFDGTTGKVIKKADNLRLGDAENSWNGKINPTTKALEFFPNDLSSTPNLSMLPNGVMLMPWQPKAAAIIGTTPNFANGTDFFIGSNLAMTKILDQDGYNESADNFFPGDGNGNGMYYTTNYEGCFYIISFSLNLDKGQTALPSDVGVFTTKIRYNNRLFTYRTSLGANITFSTQSGFVIVKSVKGEKITISTACNIGTPHLSSFGSDSIDNYIGIYMLG